MKPESIPEAAMTNFKQLENDIVEIEGIKYSGGLFRSLGFAPVGTIFRILSRDGVLILQTVSPESIPEADKEHVRAR